MGYDYTIVGAGLYGCTFAAAMRARGKRVLVLEKSGHVAGNAHTAMRDGVLVHEYGPHLFRTNSPEIWAFVQSFAEFHPYVHRVRALSGRRVFTLPFCMATMCEIWGKQVATVKEAREQLHSVTAQWRYRYSKPENLEQQALTMVGSEIHAALIKDYTEKQWGRRCDELPASIIKRLPVRFNWDDRYSAHRYQGVPIEGYTAMCERMLEGCDVQVMTPWDGERHGRLVYSGPLDALFNHDEGHLEYRGLRFDHTSLPTTDYQGMGQINDCSSENPWTRVVEHRHFMQSCDSPRTVVTTETPVNWVPGDRQYYPVNDEANEALAQRYRQRAAELSNVLVGGRLGSYRYYDMDQVIGMALADAGREA